MSYEKPIREYYQRTLRENDTPWGKVGWGSEKGQDVRLDLLSEVIGKAKSRSILDVGCGIGGFAAYCPSSGYLGIDIVPQMVDEAKARDPYCEFEVRDILKHPFDRKFDAVVASGLFGLQLETMADNLMYTEHMVKAMWDHCTKVCAFNMLSIKAPKKHKTDMYFAPSFALEMAMRHTPFVTLRHDYRQNDFTIAMYREQQS